MDILAEYDFQIQHRKQSRLPCKQCGLAAPPSHCDKDLPIDDGNCDDVTNDAMAAETRFEGDPKQEQKEDADLQQVVSWLLHNNVPIALPTSGSYWLQTLWLQKNHLLLKDGIHYRQWLDVPGGGSNRHLQLVVPKSWIRSV